MIKRKNNRVHCDVTRVEIIELKLLLSESCFNRIVKILRLPHNNVEGLKFNYYVLDGDNNIIMSYDRRECSNQGGIISLKTYTLYSNSKSSNILYPSTAQVDNHNDRSNVQGIKNRSVKREKQSTTIIETPAAVNFQDDKYVIVKNDFSLAVNNNNNILPSINTTYDMQTYDPIIDYIENANNFVNHFSFETLV